MFKLITCGLFGAVVVALVVSIASAAPSVRSKASPSGCRDGEPARWATDCEWLVSPRRFAYCNYRYDDSDPGQDRWRMLCVSPVSANWVRMTCCDDNRASYGRDRRFRSFQRPAEVVYGEWLSDRPSDAVARCRANVHFFFCSLNYEIAVWFKPDGSWALVRRREDGRWKLEARG